MVFQDTEGSLNPRKNIERSIHEVLRLLDVPKKQWTEKTLEILDTVGLSEELLCRNPCQVSGGQNQRVALGRVLLLNPKIMILDEPTSALDLSVQAQILNLLTDLQKERKLAYLLVSHQPEVVKFMTREVYVLEGGRLVQRV
jgi:peptide/nickel transport system ATP-binding protein